MANKATPRAVLFDLDGTLIDSYDAITASVNEVRRTRGLATLTVESVRPMVGHGVEKLLKSAVEGTVLEVDLPIYKEHHFRACVEQTRELPGATRLVHGLGEIGIAAGICSNKPVAFTKRIVEALGWTGLFGAVCGPEDSARPKPDPDMLLAAGARLGVGPDKILYVGDMIVDIMAGRAAGCQVWVVATGSESPAALQEAGPDAAFANLLDLAAALGIAGSPLAVRGN